MEFIVQNWQQVFDDVFFLYEQIRDSDFQPDIIVGIARGGWIPARLIADFLHLKKTANVKVETYQMIGQENVEATITQPIYENIEGKNILVVDDVADSGSTLSLVLDEIKENNPKEVRTAILYYKPRCTIIPDYYIHETSAWVLFSWSQFEAMEELSQRWKNEGMTVDDIKLKFKKIGLSAPLINSYFDS